MKTMFERFCKWSDQIAGSGKATVVVITIFSIIQIFANVMIYLNIIARIK